MVHANEVVSSDRLIDELWDEHPPETAATALHGFVSQLRKALEPGRASGAPGEVLLTRAPGYMLRVGPGAIDAVRFEELLADGRGALDAGEAGRAAGTLREALALWRGQALAGADNTPSTHAESIRLEEARLEALEERIDADLALGRDDELVPELEALVEREPLRERLCGQLMLALYRSGRQADALEHYQRARNTFRDRLGIEPSPRLRELEQAMLRQDPELEAGLRRMRPRRVLRRRRRALVIVTVIALVAVAAIVVGALLTRADAPLQGTPGSVAVVDPEAGRVVDTIEVGSGPVSIVFGHGSIWVANSEDDT
ncbi:MAG: BTAD domain-containing putative transcriptional regulator, partial [Gaiellaceae bacterium]